ncbi:MAG: cobalt-precorrin-5B (C(1))-methyltransferase CbiD [Oscillospiraceae bacterium]|jgi:cobalt-precorrin-5B (C1)-methyltransferase|nr:cobalt-precorrin-5B (C(1))-methyltransferase CbiD [Oscillospiraceae bacterium]
MFRNVKGKLLKCGYTTGSCAAAASAASADALLSGEFSASITIDTPKGVTLTLTVEDPRLEPATASCAIRKDGGDDPDVTHGSLIYSTVTLVKEPGITIDGGAGVGRVTKPGLDQPVGAAAINSTPRRMIADSLHKAAKRHAYGGGFSVVISVPNGEELAKRTFNPRLGILGGISILGTGGIVEPMSTRALADSIRVEIAQLAAEGLRDLLITPGNYGETFARETLRLPMRGHVRSADFIGDTLDAAAECGFRNVLLVGHIGKLVKLGIGAFNTHYSYGDGRMETLAACALEVGADLELLTRVMECVMSDAAVDVLRERGILEPTMRALGTRIDANLRRRVPESVNVGCVCFTNVGNTILYRSENAEQLLEILNADRR